jgi:TetR/AcrR family transcriptional repressor of mexJK operon
MPQVSNAIRKSHSGGRPPRDAMEQLAARVIDCAARLFMERGYAGVSIEAVAAEAGVGKNTIYRRHATKADLFQAVVDEQIRLRLRAPEGIEAGDLAGSLRRLAMLLVAAALNPETTALQRLVIAEADRFPEIAAICLDRAFRPAIGMARSVLDHHAKARAAPADLDFAAEQFVAAIVYGPHLHALLGRRDLTTTQAIEHYADRAVTLFLGGWS